MQVEPLGDDDFKERRERRGRHVGGQETQGQERDEMMR